LASHSAFDFSSVAHQRNPQSLASMWKVAASRQTLRALVVLLTQAGYAGSTHATGADATDLEVADAEYATVGESAISTDAEPPSGGDEGSTLKRRRGRVELKRQATSRGTPSESTKTTLRIEGYPEGSIALLRLDLPFPDDKTGFSGSPFDPRLGDIKVKVGAREIELNGIPLSPYVEVTFPTANPESLGSGKYQVAPAIETALSLASIGADSNRHELFFGALIQQFVSVAGDQAAKDINYTKFEVKVQDVWRKDYSAKVTLKPVVDWVEDGRTGAVVELEGRVNFSHGWSVSLMLGKLAWGAGVPSTYSNRVELTLRNDF
jgi:hypothetical protein